MTDQLNNQILVIGAGMAGLLAANILRKRPVTVLERQSELPNNHHGVLRFRTSNVSRETSIDFRSVTVHKGIDQSDPLVAAMEYSKKVTGRYEMRSVIDTDSAMRWVAPTDFIRRMADGAEIVYGVDFFDGSAGWEIEEAEELHSAGEMPAVISTIPMPALMDILGYDGPRPDFNYQEGWSFEIEVANCDVFATRYYTSPNVPFYRTSITGNRITVEFTGPRPTSVPPEKTESEDVTLITAWLGTVLDDFGIDRGDVFEVKAPKDAKYAKIGNLSALDKRRANDFMFWASHNFNIYSLGRFATWRAGLLLDDVVNDVKAISRWIDDGNYARQKDQ